VTSCWSIFIQHHTEVILYNLLQFTIYSTGSKEVLREGIIKQREMTTNDVIPDVCVVYSKLQLRIGGGYSAIANQVLRGQCHALAR